MAAFSATTTSNGAFNAIVANGNAVPKPTANPTRRQFQKWERAMTGPATIVPSNRESYDIGHVYLVKNEADFRKYVNDQAANVTEQARPDKKPTFDSTSGKT